MTSNQSQHMKCTLTAIIVVLLSLAAVMLIPGTCSSPYDARLQRIDSLMDSCPQAAYDSLSLFDSLHLYDDDKASRMRLLMLKAKAQNKLYLPMPSDTIFNEVVSYYDRHGSANDRMLSRYLLGCIYRDMDNGPKAVRCYLEAVEQADTTDKNCDYRVLCRLYGQLTEFYKMRNLPKEALQELDKYIYYAEKAGDTVSACFGHEAMIYLHYALGDTVSALSKVEDCRNRYLEHGMHEEAAGVYPVLIYVCIERGQFSKARYYMDIYERESGLFDSSNNILAGREHYYKALGQYFLGISRNDSAEYYFRKLGNYNYGYESAQGLLKVYSVKNDNDSVSKYTRLCEAEMDSILTQKKASELIQASSSHTFDRIKTKANKSRKILTVIALLCAVVAVVLVFYGRRQFRKYKSRIANLGNSLSETEEAYRQISNSHKKAICEVDIEHVSESSVYCPDVTRNKESDVFAGKTDKQKEYKKIFIESAENTREFVTKNAGYVGNLKQKADIGKPMSSNEWKALRNDVAQNLGKIYNIVFEKGILSEQEAKVCILLLLGLKSGHIAALIGKSSQRVSNAKAIINKKLFGSTDARSLLRYLYGTK